MEFDAERMKIKLCKECKGLGKTDGEDCPDCGGTGRIVEEDDKYEHRLGAVEFDPDGMKVKLCKSCKGLGETEDGACPDCGGTGRYVEEHRVNQFPFSQLI